MFRGCAGQVVKRCIMCSAPMGGHLFWGGGGMKSYSSVLGGSLSGIIWSTRSSGQSSNCLELVRPSA